MSAVGQEEVHVTLGKGSGAGSGARWLLAEAEWMRAAACPDALHHFSGTPHQIDWAPQQMWNANVTPRETLSLGL